MQQAEFDAIRSLAKVLATLDEQGTAAIQQLQKELSDARARIAELEAAEAKKSK